MPDITYAGLSYRTIAERDAAIAYNWMTAHGQNTSDTIDELIAENADPRHYARECVEAWELDDHKIDFDDLVRAFADFIADRPDYS